MGAACQAARAVKELLSDPQNKRIRYRPQLSSSPNQQREESRGDSLERATGDQQGLRQRECAQDADPPHSDQCDAGNRQPGLRRGQARSAALRPAVRSGR